MMHRSPEAIITDLLRFVGLNELGYDEHADEIKAVTEEANEYLRLRKEMFSELAPATTL